MKHLKNPTLAQRKIMEDAGVPSDRYKVEKDNSKYLYLRAIKNNQIVRIIDKASGEIVEGVKE